MLGDPGNPIMVEPDPQPGMGATLCYPNDRYAYTVVRLMPARTILVAKADGSGKEWEFRKAKDGYWYRTGSSLRLTIGKREEYRCPEI